MLYTPLANENDIPVEAISNSHVESLTENRVALARVGDDLKHSALVMECVGGRSEDYNLCVAAAHVENNRIVCTRYETPHFDVTNAVIDWNERLSPELSKSS